MSDLTEFEKLAQVLIKGTQVTFDPSRLPAREVLFESGGCKFLCNVNREEKIFAINFPPTAAMRVISPDFVWPRDSGNTWKSLSEGTRTAIQAIYDKFMTAEHPVDVGLRDGKWHVCYRGTPAGRMFDKGIGRKGLGFPSEITGLGFECLEAAVKASVRFKEYLTDLSEKRALKTKPPLPPSL